MKETETETKRKKIRNLTVIFLHPVHTLRVLAVLLLKIIIILQIFQGRVPLSRTVSMEQRWQDLANLLSFPPGMGVGMGDMSSHAAAAHYSSHYPYQVWILLIIFNTYNYLCNFSLIDNRQVDQYHNMDNLLIHYHIIIITLIPIQQCCTMHHWQKLPHSHHHITYSHIVRIWALPLHQVCI